MLDLTVTFYCQLSSKFFPFFDMLANLSLTNASPLAFCSSRNVPSFTLLFTAQTTARHRGVLQDFCLSSSVSKTVTKYFAFSQHYGKFVLFLRSCS